MNTLPFEFTLVIEDTIIDTKMALLKAGCDDALLSFRDQCVFIGFCRQATSLTRAIDFATSQIIEAGYHVGRIDFV